MEIAKSALFDDDLTSESVFPEWIKTPNLRLVRMDTNFSIEEVYSLLHEREELSPVFETVRGWPPQTSRDDTREYLNEWEGYWESGEKAGYIVQRKVDDSIIGGAWFLPNWEMDKTELGVWLLPEYWGNGYSTEQSHAFTEVAFELYSFEYVELRTATMNENAQKSIESFLREYRESVEPDGIIQNDDVNHYGDLLDCLVYTVSREEYEQSKSD